MTRQSKRKSRFGLAVLAFEVNGTGKEMQLLPAGEFRAQDGRPFECPSWKIDADIAANVIRRANVRANRMVIDYEHQTLNSKFNGQPAPASGWFKQMAWRDAGLFATDVEWTSTAQGYIDRKEYKYVSAVFRYDPVTGEVLDMLMAALTNNPALDGMAEVGEDLDDDELENLAAARFSFDPDQSTTQEDAMKAALALLLGLPSTATEEEVMSRVTALKNGNAERDAQIAALKAADPDPAKYVPIATMQALQDQVADLTIKLNEKEIGDLISGALKEGKLLPAQEAWATDLGKKDVAALTSFLASAQPVAALSGTQTQGKDQGKQEGELDESELAICTRMGIDPEDFKKTKTAA